MIRSGILALLVSSLLGGDVTAQGGGAPKKPSPEVAALKAVAERTPPAGEAPLPEVTEALVEGLSNGKMAVRLEAAKALGSNQVADLALPALDAALRRAMQDERDVVVAQIFVWTDAKGKPVDEKGNRFVPTMALKADEIDSPTYGAKKKLGRPWKAVLTRNKRDLGSSSTG